MNSLTILAGRAFLLSNGSVEVSAEAGRKI
jgi:hypothetical protein